MEINACYYAIQITYRVSKLSLFYLQNDNVVENSRKKINLLYLNIMIIKETRLPKLVWKVNILSPLALTWKEKPIINYVMQSWYASNMRLYINFFIMRLNNKDQDIVRHNLLQAMIYCLEIIVFFLMKNKNLNIPVISWQCKNIYFCNII